VQFYNAAEFDRAGGLGAVVAAGLTGAAQQTPYAQPIYGGAPMATAFAPMVPMALPVATAPMSAKIPDYY
jgi:hypothetical protein